MTVFKPINWLAVVNIVNELRDNHLSCNLCHKLTGQRFSLADECGHMACEACAELEENKNTCSICPSGSGDGHVRKEKVSLAADDLIAFYVKLAKELNSIDAVDGQSGESNGIVAVTETEVANGGVKPEEEVKAKGRARKGKVVEKKVVKGKKVADDEPAEVLPVEPKDTEGGGAKKPIKKKKVDVVMEEKEPAAEEKETVLADQESAGDEEPAVVAAIEEKPTKNAAKRKTTKGKGAVEGGEGDADEEATADDDDAKAKGKAVRKKTRKAK